MIDTSQPAVACIGAGHWGTNLIRNFHELNALALICDSDGRRLKAARSQYPDVDCTESFNTVLADARIGAVAVATPAETHAVLVRQALLAGKDVFVEKPLCLDVEEGRSLIALASAQQRILMVGHLLWYHPAILKLKQLIEDGELGRIRYIYSNRLNLGMIRREENILWSFAPHDISVILGLISEMPDHVEAQGGNYLHDRIADVTVSLLSFPSGIKAHVFVSWLHPYKEQKLIVVGERQMAVFDDVAADHKLVLYPHVILWKGQMPVPHKAKGRPVPIDKGEPLRAECEHFLGCLQSRQMPRTNGEEGLRVLTVLQQCQSVLADNGPKARVLAKGAHDYFTHPSAFIDEDVEIGTGTSVWHVSHILRNSRVGKDCRIGQNVVIGPNVRVGDRVKIQNNVSVYEGVTLEDQVFCGPSVVFTNVHNPRSEIRRMDEVRPTLVRYGATLGANCTIVCGVTVGRYAFVGAGAVVTKDVPDFALVVGNPARVAGWMCACGNRIKLKESEGDGVCGACQKRYQKIGREVRAA
ncbi:MAG TPA: Gfo/Idh/MocA family oxidoreductase [Candidatus Binatia bacterium]